MIISDLSHFEEIVAETHNIVGGVALGKVVDGDVAQDLKESGFGYLLGTQVNVNSSTVNTKGGTATVETAVGKTKKGVQIKSSSSDSTAVKVKK